MENRPYPLGLAWDEALLQRTRADAAEAEVRRLSPYESIAKSYRELPEQYHRGMLELLVKASFEAAEISTGRAAELLKCSICDIREKGWSQGKKDEEIAELRQRISDLEQMAYNNM